MHGCGAGITSRILLGHDDRYAQDLVAVGSCTGDGGGAHLGQPEHLVARRDERVEAVDGACRGQRVRAGEEGTHGSVPGRHRERRGCSLQHRSLKRVY
jgi:hypothetical protein